MTFVVLPGLVIAVLLAILLLVIRAANARLTVVGRAPDRLLMVDVVRHQCGRTIHVALAVRPARNA
jgi:hypothetical protein